MSQLQIIKSAVFGHIVGDALGVPVEFVQRDKLTAHPVTDILGFRSHNMPKGTWSDDSSMMLCTLVSLSEMRNPDFHDMMSRFSRWAKEGYLTPYGKAFGIGRTTLYSLGKFWRGAEASACGCCSEKDNGNGSVMRILPLALYLTLKKSSYTAPKDKIGCIHAASALTHAHPRACMACGIFLFVLEELVSVPDKASVLVGLQKAQAFYSTAPEFHTYDRLFSTHFPSLSADAIHSSGYVVDTMEAAMWCLLNSSSYKECMLKAVNLGGDTDTIAAVAGGLSGILYGYESIPAEWIEVVAMKQEIESMCEAFCNSIG